MLRATATSSVPLRTETVISDGSPRAGVTRNRSSPLDAALPLGVMFQEPANGGAATATDESRLAAVAISRARRVPVAPCRRAPAHSGAAVIVVCLFALDLDAHVLHVGIDELQREVGLTLLLLDQDVFAIVDLDGEALRAEFRGERVTHVLRDVVLGAAAADVDGDVGGLTLARRHPELHLAGLQGLAIDL